MFTFVDASNALNQSYKTAVMQAKGEVNISWLRHKYRHSFEVLEFGERLLNHDVALKSFSEQNIENAKSALLLHDLGRIFQLDNDRFNLNFSHSFLGEKILRENLSCSDYKILLAVKYHEDVAGVDMCLK